MTDRELEARLARAMADAAPDRLDDLLRVREGRRAPEGGGDKGGALRQCLERLGRRSHVRCQRQHPHRDRGQKEGRPPPEHF